MACPRKSVTVLCSRGNPVSKLKFMHFSIVNFFMVFILLA